MARRASQLLAALCAAIARGIVPAVLRPDLERATAYLVRSIACQALDRTPEEPAAQAAGAEPTAPPARGHTRPEQRPAPRGKPGKAHDRGTPRGHGHHKGAKGEASKG